MRYCLNNNFTVTITNAAAASKAKQIADESLRSLHSEMLSALAADSLAINDDVTLFFEECCFSSANLVDVSKTIVKTIANNMKKEFFEFSARACDTYSEAWMDGSFQNGELNITSTFFPEGYYEEFECPECGEMVVSLEDYDPNKTYVCPKCGEELDFSDIAPEIERETIHIF